MSATKTMLLQFGQLLRVKHWVKNLFVFIPAFFAGQLDAGTIVQIIPVFISFCLVASIVYLINDLVDLPRDRLHPVKQLRPLASGYFSSKTAYRALAVLGLLFCLILGCLQSSAYLPVAYLLLNIAYSLYLKHLAVIDVAVIGLGFVLRILAGGFEGGIFVSEWLISIIFLLCTALAFAKRRNDLVLTKTDHAASNAIQNYSLSFLDVAITISMSITLMMYIVYSLSAAAIERLGSDKIYITSIFVFLGIMRYLQLNLSQDKAGSPVEIIWRDRVLQVVILLWVLSFCLLIYG